jgi:hypothetical protein
MDTRKLIRLFIISQLISLCVAAQDDALEFKIVKLKTAQFYPDTIPILHSGDTLRLSICGGLGISDIAGISFDRGTVSIAEDMIILPVSTAIRSPKLSAGMDTADLRTYLDTGVVIVRLRPDVHARDTILRKLVYILPDQPWHKTGFHVKWNKTIFQTYSWNRKNTKIRVIHHIPKEKLLTDLADSFRYQNYSSADTMPRCFDSLYATVSVQKKNYRFHLSGSHVSPELIDMIRLMHMGDRLRIRLYWTDQGVIHRETAYFRISIFSFTQDVI